MTDQIELYCPHCGAVTQLAFAKSDRSARIVCQSCGGIFHWIVCPACDTGYYNADAAAPCPECQSGEAIEKPSSNSLFVKLIAKACPWCAAPIPWAGFIEGRGPGRCPHCRRAYDLLVWKALCLTLGIPLLLLVIFEKSTAFVEAVSWVQKARLEATCGILFVLAGVYIWQRLIGIRQADRDGGLK